MFIKKVVQKINHFLRFCILRFKKFLCCILSDPQILIIIIILHMVIFFKAEFYADLKNPLKKS
jgi:hypothetical protein